MKISIIVPIYNVEQYVGQCIESILAQNYDDIEILLVNNGSTDGSVTICEMYEKKHSTIKLIHQTNGGLSAARNMGILNATGDYILFIDSDDYWESDFLSELVQHTTNLHYPDYILLRYSYFYQQSNTVMEQTYPFQESGFIGKGGIDCLGYILKQMPDFHWYAWAGFVKREFILDYSLFFEMGRKYEDALWTPNVLLHARSVGYFDKPIVMYRLEREGQITSELSYSIFQDSFYVVEKWEQVLRNIEIDNEIIHLLLNNLSERYFYCLKFAAFLPGDEREQLLSLLKKNKHLRQFKSKKIDFFIVFLTKIIGFKGTSLLLKHLLQIKKTKLRQGLNQ